MKFFSKSLLLFLFSLLPTSGFNQSLTGGSSKIISRLSFQSFMEPGPILEAGLSVGAANSITDIAYNSYNSSKMSLSGINMKGMSPAAATFVRYRFNELVALKTSFSAMKIRGNDNWSSDDSIAGRGKFFNNRLFELALLGEVYLPQNLLNSTNGFRLNYFDMYLFGGISGFYHSPILGGPILDEFDLVLQLDPNPYNNWQMAIPFGAGFKWSVAQSWTIGMDLIIRYTFLDHLDGFTRPVSYGSDIFLTSKFSIGFILDDRRRHANRVGNRYVANPFRPKVKRSTY
jgi:hypothetical protein